jgi:hypothetical protein
MGKNDIKKYSNTVNVYKYTSNWHNIVCIFAELKCTSILIIVESPVTAFNGFSTSYYWKTLGNLDMTLKYNGNVQY